MGREVTRESRAAERRAERRAEQRAGTVLHQLHAQAALRSLWYGGGWWARRRGHPPPAGREIRGRDGAYDCLSAPSSVGA